MALLKSIKTFLSERFNLNEDKEDELVIIESIRKGVEFKGTNLWTLIFAIFIASIGLNVNSTHFPLDGAYNGRWTWHRYK